MNSDEPSRDEIEARLTALLLGELPDDEARLLRWTISQDAALKKLHDRLQRTIGFVRETAKAPTDAPAEKNVPLKLSDDRRQKLLAHFKTPRPQAPKELFWLKRIEVPHLIPVLAAVAIIALLAALLMPALSKAKNKAIRVQTIQGLAGNGVFKNEASASDQLVADARSAGQPSAPPVVTALPPEPVLAPPPPEIVLPQPNSTAEITLSPAPAAPQSAATVTVTLPAGGVVEDQQLSGELAFVEANKQPSPALSSQKAGVVHNLAGGGGGGGGGLGAGRAGRGGRGAGGGRSAGETESPTANAIQNSATLAWEDSITDRSLAENQPANYGSDNRRLGPTDTAGPTFNFQAGSSAPPSAAASPTGTFPGANAGVDFALNDAGQSAKLGYGLANDGYDFKGDVATAPNQTVSEERFYRNGVSESDADKLPALGEARRLPPARSRSVNAPVATASPAPIVMPSHSLDSFADSFNPPTVIANGSLTLNGENTFSGGTVVNSGTLSRQGDSWNLGVEKPSERDADGSVFNAQNGDPQQAAAELKNMFQLGSSSIASPSSQNSVLQQSAQNATTAIGGTSTVGGTVVNNGTLNSANISVDPVTHNVIVIADKKTESQIRQIVANLDATTATPPGNVSPSAIVPATGLPENTERQNLSEAETPAYNDAKRKLAQMEAVHNLLNAKIKSMSIDAAIPASTMVAITAPAEPAKSQSLWQRLNGEYVSDATIKVENEGGIIAGLNESPAVATSSYDPYFVQTATEVIQSDAVLGKVVDALKLNEVWAKNNGGEQLNKKDAIALLKKRLNLQPVKNTKQIEIGATSDDPKEAAEIANAVAKAYQDYRVESAKQTTATGLTVLQQQYAEEEKQISDLQAKVQSMEPKTAVAQTDQPLPKPPANAPIPQPEILTRENAFSTFSLNVSDVSFKLAAASLENGRLPDAASIRSEEFINAFDYRDPEAATGQPVAFASERARYPFAQNRDLLRFSIKTAAAGRAADRPLNLVLLLDTSGSMERADRVAIIREAMRVLTTQLHPQDTVSVVTFARVARLWADGVTGDKAGETLSQVGGITPEGGTNLEEAMRLAYETARRHYLANGLNRVVLLTDGAANLGNVDAAALKQKVETQRKQGIALDCFGIGWEDFNDNMLAELSGNGDGRYAFINSPEDAGTEFAAKLAGALQVAAQDVKVQVEFNPQRVTSWRQIGYAKHQLTKEQFRDNSVLAAEIAAQEAGNALYTVETKPDGIGPIATVYVRYKIPGTDDVQEHSWEVPYAGNAPALEKSSPAMRLAATAGAFSEWLASSPFAQEVSPDALLKNLSGVPEIYGADQRPKQLETMIREAKSISGK